MHPDDRAEQGWRQGGDHPAGLHAEHEQCAANGLGRKRDVSEPPRQADVDEKACRAGKAKGAELQDQAVREIHDAEREPQQEGREFGLS